VLYLCRVSKKDTRQRNSLPSVKNKTLGKELIRRVFSFTEGLCRVPEIKRSAKNLALGKEPNSDSDRLARITKITWIYILPQRQLKRNEESP
jgi:hypothetical protein